MKPRVAAILSITGVLAAGSAAALVNTRVLEGDGQPESAAPGPPSTVPGTVATIPAETTAPSTPRPRPRPGRTTTTIATTTIPSTTTTTAAPAAAAPAPPGVYQIGAAGSVTLSTAGDVLTIVSVDPAPGWEIHEAENEDAHSVEVRLRSDDDEVRFEANLLFGVVNTSLRSDDDSDDDDD